MSEITPDIQPSRKPALSWNFIDMIALLAIVAVTLFTLFFPYDHYKKSTTKLKDARERLIELTLAKNEEILRLKNQEKLTDILQKRKPDFTLFSYLNTALSEKGLKERADLQEIKDKKNPQEVTYIKLSLRGVAMKEFVDFLHALYTSNNLIVVDRLDTLKASSDNRGVDCDLVLLSPKQQMSKTS